MKKVLVITLSILAVLSLAGCGNKKKEENNPESNNQGENNNQQEKNERITIKNPGCVIGKEEYTVKLNGKNRVLKLEYYNYDKSEYDFSISNDDNSDNDFYLTYKFYIDGAAIDGIESLNGKIYMYDDRGYDNSSIEKLMEADGTKNLVAEDRTIINQGLEDLSIKTSILKGNDKEYLIIFMYPPTPWPTEHIFIVNDTGKLLGELYVDKAMGVKLSGNDVKKYNPNGYHLTENYYYLTDDKIVYLKPTHEMYTNDGYVKAFDRTITFDEYAITIKNGNLLNTKTNNQYKGTDVEGGDSEITMFYAK